MTRWIARWMAAATIAAALVLVGFGVSRVPSPEVAAAAVLAVLFVAIYLALRPSGGSLLQIGVGWLAVNVSIGSLSVLPGRLVPLLTMAGVIVLAFGLLMTSTPDDLMRVTPVLVVGAGLAAHTLLFGGGTSAARIDRAITLGALLTVLPLAAVTMVRIHGFMIPRLLARIIVGGAAAVTVAFFSDLTAETSHIEVGRVTGLGLVVAALGPFRPPARGALIVITGTGALLSGSRQGLIAPLLTLLAVGAIEVGRAASGSRRSPRAVGPLLGVVAVVALVSFPAFSLAVSQPGTAGDDTTWAVQRQSRILSVDSILNSGTTRDRIDNYYAAAWRDYRENPISGVGLAEPLVLEDGRVIGYPHNLVLELARGVGTAGLALGAGVVIMMLIAAVIAVSRGSADLAGLGLFTVIVAMVSGNIDTNRLLFFTATALVAGVLLGGGTGQNSWASASVMRRSRLVEIPAVRGR